MHLPLHTLPHHCQLFDSHCHFDFDEFGGELEREQLWQACRERGIEHLLIPGVSPEQWAKSAAITAQCVGVKMSVGVHPWWVESRAGALLSDGQLQEMESYLSNPDCVAIGECGLDGLLDFPLAKQEPIFEQQLQLACSVSKPLILHVRKAHNLLLKLLAQYRPSAGGVIHGFTGSAELAAQYWALGFYIGVGGSITYPRANKTRKAIQLAPLESLLLETDAPDMPLNGCQGQANNPLKLIDIAVALAELREEPVETICRSTTENSCRLFSI